MDRLASGANYFTSTQSMFAEQKDTFLAKLNADFDLIFTQIERKRTEL